MNIHEYQAKGLLARYGVAAYPRAAMAFTPDEAENVARELGGPIWVVKAQIHAGGRGKGGGVPKRGRRRNRRGRRTPQDARHVLVTTRPDRRRARRSSASTSKTACDIARELYLGMLMDRATSRVTIMASSEGGMDIEEVAAKRPEKILKVAVDPASASCPIMAERSPSASA